MYDAYARLSAIRSISFYPLCRMSSFMLLGNLASAKLPRA